jgi:hypothetical protein
MGNGKFLDIPTQKCKKTHLYIDKVGIFQEPLAIIKDKIQ